MTTMAGLASKVSKVVLVGTMMMLLMVMGLMSVQASTLTFGNLLSPGKELTVHCKKDEQDQGARVVSYMKQFSVGEPSDFFGKYVCAFSAPGKTTTTFDAFNSRCNCNSFYGCVWIAKSNGFFCNYDIIYKWA